jgi:hypothetical protein
MDQSIDGRCLAADATRAAAASSVTSQQSIGNRQRLRTQAQPTSEKQSLL